ncbi:MAG: rRNA maturation RNase YbeY [Deltaproteobacteria bacterium GWA2_38_16]|nr:MAG: rRNA maturation RNase YbeY [Deltaproteobacteria bacterium GWA2_38_16]OGQ03908.1 MAG: rRNA maturation RNase YbeY [Deltaproteobacteria bacterium RIFCSPHIGHO2_02_FULL_38_15]OGQ31521.1 MAG: rRNA maturation RNase YbeY [Deltaproteobacteria bacterium RIFCSPLOWO2_01_FULL_38_9]OGQ60991.1 MAG: rRNA maturation RNase YbeY [Deltaproteobacteria bacterium RIFCSPLOWO2_12_FULL_38_8]
MQIIIQNKQKKIRIPLKKVNQWIKKILFLKKWGHESPPELSIIFVSDAVIQKMNKRYRGKNKPTDVLSFPAPCHSEAKPKNLLGDIMISAETAKRDSRKFKISFDEELKFLLIHGFLHLLGYDHEASRKEELRMQRQERKLWKYLK